VSGLLTDLAMLRDEIATAGDLYSSLISTRQNTVINRLTVISALLLALTVITGFHGMNFDWMVDAIGSPAAFTLLGIAIPIASVAVLLALMRRAGWLLALHGAAEDTASPQLAHS
jgi:Mg2+ and Co2+ transporter CorA